MTDVALVVGPMSRTGVLLPTSHSRMMKRGQRSRCIAHPNLRLRYDNDLGTRFMIFRY